MLLNVTGLRSILIEIAENERGLIYVECHRCCSVAFALPCERAGRARSQCALAAQLIHIEGEARLDSALSCAVMSPGATSAHSCHRFSKSFGNYMFRSMRQNSKLQRSCTWPGLTGCSTMTVKVL